MTTTEFDRDVPIPPKEIRGRRPKGHFMHRMVPGDSRFTPATEVNHSTLSSYARVVTKRSGGAQHFEVHKVVEHNVEGTRVWCVEAPATPAA